MGGVIRRREDVDNGAEVTTGGREAGGLMAAEEHHSQISYQDPIPVDFFRTVLLLAMIHELLLVLSLALFVATVVASPL
jgi:hypothetical protein